MHQPNGKQSRGFRVYRTVRHSPRYGILGISLFRESPARKYSTVHKAKIKSSTPRHEKVTAQYSNPNDVALLLKRLHETLNLVMLGAFLNRSRLEQLPSAAPDDASVR